jgi:hypothetical protein
MHYEKLARLSSIRPVLVIGGHTVQERVSWAKQEFGVTVDWPDTYRDKGVDPLLVRIRAGAPVAVILLEHLMGHRTSKRVVEAAKLANVPVTYARKGGMASMQTAFAHLEERL